MRLVSVVLAALVVLPAGAQAGFNVNYLVPGYKGCEGNAGACAIERSSSYTFETAILKSPRGRYSLREGKTTIIVQLKGVRDAGGQLVTTDPANLDDDFVLLLPTGRVVLPSLGTLADGSIPPQRVRIDLENGNGKVSYAAVGTQPGMVTISFESPTILDPDGNLFAGTGAAAKP
jgi:hypothetical protein